MRSFIVFILVALFAFGGLTLVGCVKKPPAETPATPEVAPETPEVVPETPVAPETPGTVEEAPAEEAPPGEGE